MFRSASGACQLPIAPTCGAVLTGLPLFWNISRS